MMKFQVTFFSEKYKPVACIVESESRLEILNKGKAYKKALEKICSKRNWSLSMMKSYGYTTFKVRRAEEE